ncbi:uncharacterized protein LOC142986736 [Anticarsia gemmatalis]|uniref:uncharacterized protein LOC142986736 n=1 Tax=Anticarsia gemmatalis TaxID=129554 RepID=UPI003F76CFB2
MIWTIAVLCLLAAPAFGIWEKGLRVRFGADPSTYGSTSFIHMPQNITAASEKGWQEVSKPELPRGYDKLVLWCPVQDYTLCMLYDDTGYIAGLQIALNPAQFVGSIFDWTVSGFRTWSVTDDDVTTEYLTTHQYYISTEFLAKDAATRIAARSNDYLLQDDQIYLSGFYGELLNVSRYIPDIEGSTFTRQGCLAGMGNHFYYNMTKSLECRDDTILPWFPLETDDQLIGVGFLIPGQYIIEDGKLDPFEPTTPLAIMQTIVPGAPDCLYAYGDYPGEFTMHTYFIEDGPLVTCT